MTTRHSESLKETKKFALTLAAAFALLACLFYWKGRAIWKVFAIISAAFTVSRLFFPAVLGPLQKVWMKIAHALGWFNTRVILTLLYFFIFTPIRLLLSVLGKDLLERKILKAEKSYWIQKESNSNDPQRYERLF